MSGTQLPLYLPKADWVPPKVAELPSWAQAQRVSVDVETCDPKLTKLGPGVRRGAYICGVSFAIEDGPAFYLPVRHQNGTNLDQATVFAYLREQADKFKGDLVGANLSYDLDFLLEAGIEFRPRYFRDVQVAEPLLDEHQLVYSLDAIAGRWQLPGKDRSLLEEAAKAFGIHPGHELYKLPPEFVATYGMQDVRLPLQLLRRQEAKIDEEELWDIYNLESELLPVLVRMRRRGVAVSFKQLDFIEKWSLERETETLKKVEAVSGVHVAVGDVWKAGPMAAVLRKVGIEPPKTAASKDSITKDFLESVKDKHPVASLLVEARQVNKVRTTFVESVREHAVRGRIHCTFKQLRGTGDDGSDGESGGGRFGRLSCTDPNLQQQPARHEEIGPMWRAVYLPDEGMQWACNDFSQQEPRWMTHFAELLRCGGAKEAADRYRNDPKTDNHQMMAELTGLPRKYAKNIFLGKCYGMGGAKLCHQLKLPTKYIQSRSSGRTIEVAGDEGQSIIDQFDARVPYVKQLSARCDEKAARTGFIRTVLGRRCRFPKVQGAYEGTHKALNRLVQGSSADQTKKAMVEADRAGVNLQLQVHDELDLSVIELWEAEVCAEIMRNVVPCNVPTVVDIELGPDWGHTVKQ